MRILVAEDEALLAEGLIRTLRQSGHAVDWVENGLQAESALEANEFDLLIPLNYDQIGRVARLNDAALELSAREVCLLEIFLRRASRLVSKDQLVNNLCEWGEEVSANAIEVYVHHLRKKLEPGGGASSRCAAWAIAWKSRPLDIIRRSSKPRLPREGRVRKAK